MCNEEIDELNEISMQIILNAGDGRSLIQEALTHIEDEDYSPARKKLSEAHKKFVKAHAIQTSTIQREAEGERIRYSTLFAHAQDTLMTVQSEYLISKKLVDIFEKLSQKLQTKINEEE